MWTGLYNQEQKLQQYDRLYIYIHVDLKLKWDEASFYYYWEEQTF
jgi:hypothetical protein